MIKARAEEFADSYRVQDPTTETQCSTRNSLDKSQIKFQVSDSYNERLCLLENVALPPSTSLHTWINSIFDDAHFLPEATSGIRNSLAASLYQLDWELSRDQYKKLSQILDRPSGQFLQAASQLAQFYAENYKEWYRESEETPQIQERKKNMKTRFSEAYEFLIRETTSGVGMSLKQLEIDYKQAMEKLMEDQNRKTNDIRTRQSKEMEIFSQKSPDKIPEMLRKHMGEIEMLERKSRQEQNELKKRQLLEFHNFVMQFYQIELQRQHEARQNSRSQQASPFSPISSPSSGPKILKTAQSTQTQLSHDYISPELEQAIKETMTIQVGSGKAASQTLMNVRVTDLYMLDFCRIQTELEGNNSTYSNSLRGIVMFVDPDLTYKSRLNREFLALCNLGTEIHFDTIDAQLDEMRKSLANSANKLRDSSSPSALRAFTTSTLSNHSSGNANNSLGNSNSSLSNSTSSLSSPSNLLNTTNTPSNNTLNSNSPLLQEGDWFITKHSNLGAVNVVFHLATNTTTTTPTTPLSKQHPLVRGLLKVLRAAAQFDVETLALPVAMAEIGDEPLRMATDVCLQRAAVVMEVLHEFVCGVESEDIAQYQLVVPRISNAKEVIKGIRAQVPLLFKLIE